MKLLKILLLIPYYILYFLAVVIEIPLVIMDIRFYNRCYLEGLTNLYGRYPRGSKYEHN